MALGHNDIFRFGMVLGLKGDGRSDDEQNGKNQGVSGESRTGKKSTHE